MSDHSKVVELEAEVAKLNSALTKSNDTIENLIIRVEDQKLQIDSLKVFKDLVVPKFVGIPNVTFRPKTTFDDFSQTYNTSFSASQKFNPTDGFVLQSIGIYNDNAFSVYLDVNFPFGSSFYVDHHDHSIKVNLNLLNPNGARTIGCGCLFKKGNYNGILFKNKTVVFFTLSGQFLGKFIEIEDGADFSPKFEVAGRDLDVQEFAKPNFTGNFQLNLDQVFDNEAYKADEWTVVDDNQE
uniref:Lectin_legB domain-containing protein n=1 Tax=Meloidogyne hapla TaxID=6305 RepID=A0A1I8BMT1_MELHA